jgi:hypothetical protein
MKQDREMLAEHGTKLMELKPSSVLQTAVADLARRGRNAERGEAMEGGYEQYAFHRRHVRRARDPGDLLRRAAEEPGLGQASAKYTTRLLYSDPTLLRAAGDLFQ